VDAEVSERPVVVIRASLPAIRRHLASASDRFYVNLFTLAPELRALFPPDMAEQGMRFMSTLVLMANLLQDAWRAAYDHMAEETIRRGLFE
jgi:hemoglobin-like flavoprotein